MKKIGIVGGIGPASTVEYYRGIIEGIRQKTQSDQYPRIVITSINMTEMLSFVSQADWDSLVALLVGAVEELARAGAEIAAIASNTPHIVFDAVAEQVSLPLVSIVSATCDRASSEGCHKAIVLGTRFTMSNDFYSTALQKRGITAILPSPSDQAVVHDIIFPKLEDGIVDPVDKQKLLELSHHLILEHKADALILGCTELPLMISNDALSVLTLNTTQIHIDALVKLALTP